jgi:hypothetical protein
MNAPLVDRLQAEILVCTDEARKAELRAQLGCYLARSGDLAAAEAIRSELRGLYGDGRFARVSILIMCLEAFKLYFNDLDPKALDRLVRANLLSTALKDAELSCLTSAWLAHLYFNQERFEELGRSLENAFSLLDDSNDAARCRLAIVLADAFTLLGDQLSSRHWYNEARDSATKLGDQAAFGAITYNRAALQVYTARLRAALGEDIGPELGRIGLELSSAVNYQAIARLTSLDHLLHSARVSVQLLQRDFSGARATSRSILDDAGTVLTPSYRAALRFDYAFASKQLGALDEWKLYLESEDLVGDLAACEPGEQVIMLAEIVKDRKNLEPSLCKAKERHQSASSALLSAVSRFSRSSSSKPA